MPTATKGITVLDEDGNYNIYISDRLSHAMRMETYEHELAHIKRGDHYSEATIRDKENVPATLALSIVGEDVKPPIIEEERRRKRVERNYRRIKRELQSEIRAMELRRDFPGRERRRALTMDEFMQLIKKPN